MMARDLATDSAQTAATETMPAASIPPVRGPIIISRHGKPALDRTKGPRLRWQDYVDWWARYERGSLAEGQIPPEALLDAVKDVDIALTSQRPRAQETAALAAPHLQAEPHALFNEAPLPPPRLPRVRYLPKTWNVLARTAWLNGHTLDGGESVHQARQRAALAAEMLHEAAREGKVYLAAHGWFNRMLRPPLRAHGWQEVHNGGDRYWSFRIYEYRGE
ncbi:MAG: histidine phosphatase family protein [Hyphomonadaceae bacterium]|nr:histidine phosphatase family protein [Hyphomonadaceae bacterium]